MNDTQTLTPPTIQLDQPIQRGEQLISTITLREPCARDLFGLKLIDVANLDVNTLRQLLPRMSTPTLTEAEVTQFSLADLLQCGGALAHFLVPQAMRTASLTA